MASVFTKIIQKELPCEKILETEHCLAFLDLFPTSYGHTLVVTKHETPKLEELPVDILQDLMQTIQTVGHAVSKSYGNVDYNVILNNGPEAGQEVPHVHFHVIPRPEGSLPPFRRRLEYAEGEMSEVGAKIRACL